jgi:acyl-CoA synthetase (AMP-forming)/AMP-acid ligase II
MGSTNSTGCAINDGGHHELSRLDQLFEVAARAHGEKMAVRCGRHSITYRDLDRRSVGWPDCFRCVA